ASFRNLERESKVVLEVSAGDGAGGSCRFEKAPRVLSDRLEHPVALVREAQQALLDERLERVDGGVDDLFCSKQRAATGEDGKRLEDTLLLVGKEVVAPGDRRPKRLLTSVGVPSASQQVEALREALDDLRGRERLRTGGSELDGEWEVVEAVA